MPPEGDLDSPETSERRKEIILSKTFLKNFFKDCYSFFEETTEHAPKGPRLEIGSGAGFLHKKIPSVLKSDILRIPELDLTCSAQELPFLTNSLSAIYMLNVLHHIQDATLFFNEVQRCLKPGGVVTMIEPASTLWGHFIYNNFHNEAFDKNQRGWGLPAGGPLSTANVALPWIIFERDKNLFKQNFPDLRILKINYVSPFTYLLSGGFSYKQLVPEKCYPFFKFLETILHPLNRFIGLFMRVNILCVKQ